MRKRDPKILVVDDQPKTAQLLSRLAPDLVLLEGAAGKPFASSWSEAEPVLSRARGADLVVLDLKFEIPDEELLPDRRPLGDTPEAKKERRERRDKQGLLVLERIRHRWPDLPVVLTTAHEEIPFEEEARRLSADGFTYAVGEDESTAEGLVRLVRRVLFEREAPLVTGRFFWGKSAAMRELRRRIAALAPTPLPLLVSGPTGTGKNFLVKEVLHPLSGRRGPLVSFDCATVPETLLPAALFGSVRGAYTGAISDRPGVFEAAAGGTLFLDEIENLSGDSQKMLLTALNDGVVRRIGAISETPHSARVVAAANVSLSERVRSGSFRADLLMRLNPALALDLPALRERQEDLPDLARLVTSRFFATPSSRRALEAAVRASGGPEPREDARIDLALGEDELEAVEADVVFALPRKGWRALVKHDWPGNVRQFEMVLTDLLAAAVYGFGGARVDKKGRAIFTVDPRLLFDLLADARGEAAPREGLLVLPKPSASGVEDFRRELERSAFRHYFREAKGDFQRMAELMTGAKKDERAVRLRFNRLGLSARHER